MVQCKYCRKCCCCFTRRTYCQHSMGPPIHPCMPPFYAPVVCHNCLNTAARPSTCTGAHPNFAAAACSGACDQGCQDVCRCGRRACSSSVPGAGPPSRPWLMSCAAACRALAAVWCLVCTPSAAVCVWLLQHTSQPADVCASQHAPGCADTQLCVSAGLSLCGSERGCSVCVSIFVALLAGILRFCGDVPSGELPTPAVAVETAQKLLHQVGCSMPAQPKLWVRPEAR